MERQEITRGQDGIYRTKDGDEVSTYGDSPANIVSSAFDKLKGLVSMAVEANRIDDDVAAIADDLMKIAIEELLAIDSFFQEKFGRIEIIRAMHNQPCTDSGELVDILYKPKTREAAQ
jgi:hypothetical protein